VTTFAGILIAAGQIFLDKGDLSVPATIADLIGITSINGLSAILIICLLGGIWTFLTRAVKARSQLLAEM